MSDDAQSLEKRVQLLETRVQALQGRTSYQSRIGVAFAVGCLFLLIAQIFTTAFMIPRFSGIYKDMLGDKPLPVLTSAVFDYRWMFVGFGCVWLVAALFIARRKALPRYLPVIPFALLIGQFIFIIVALELPLHMIIKSMSPSH